MGTERPRRGSDGAFEVSHADLDVPRSEGRIEVEEDLSLHFRVIGDGNEVVLVPGACSLAAELLPLAEGHTLFFYDQRNRGCSDSVEDPSRLTMENEVRDLERVREGLELERFSLVGWSYLGAVAGLYAARHPGRVGRLLLVGPMPLRDDPAWREEAEEKTRRRVDPELAERLEEMRREGLDRSDPVRYCREHRRVHLTRQMGDAAAASRLRSEPCAHPNEWPDNVRWTLEALSASVGEAYDFRPRVAPFDGPALVIHGEEDSAPEEAAHEWAASLSGARLLKLAGVGHYPWAEAPERFFGAADQFLSGEWPREVGGAGRE